MKQTESGRIGCVMVFLAADSGLKLSSIVSNGVSTNYRTYFPFTAFESSFIYENSTIHLTVRYNMYLSLSLKVPLTPFVIECLL